MFRIKKTPKKIFLSKYRSLKNFFNIFSAGKIVVRRPTVFKLKVNFFLLFQEYDTGSKIREDAGFLVSVNSNCYSGEIIKHKWQHHISCS